MVQLHIVSIKVGPLDVVFNYTRTAQTGELGYSVYAKWNENDSWYESPTTQYVGANDNNDWNWNFNASSYDNPYEHTDTMSGRIGYQNVGLIIHGTGGTETVYNIYSGGDGKADNDTQGGKNVYHNYTAFSKVRVYVKYNWFVVKNSKVGIGTTSTDDFKLKVYGGAVDNDSEFKAATFGHQHTGGQHGKGINIGTNVMNLPIGVDHGNSWIYQAWNATEGWGSLVLQCRPSVHASVIFRTSIDSSISNMTERMRITSDGNVGIGTHTPENTSGWDRSVDVHGTRHSKLLVTTSDNTVQGGIFSHSHWGGEKFIIGTESNRALTFMTNYQVIQDK